MALDFSGLDTQVRVNALIAELNALDAELATLTSSASVSDQGRSMDFGATKKNITDRREAIRKELALMAGPAFVVSRTRA
jgi:hypothetical protein